jgi:hypothetical protein
MVIEPEESTSPPLRDIFSICGIDFIYGSISQARDGCAIVSKLERFSTVVDSESVFWRDEVDETPVGMLLPCSYRADSHCIG